MMRRMTSWTIHQEEVTHPAEVLQDTVVAKEVEVVAVARQLKEMQELMTIIKEAPREDVGCFLIRNQLKTP